MASKGDSSGTTWHSKGSDWILVFKRAKGGSPTIKTIFSIIVTSNVISSLFYSLDSLSISIFSAIKDNLGSTTSEIKGNGVKLIPLSIKSEAFFCCACCGIKLFFVSISSTSAIRLSVPAVQYITRTSETISGESGESVSINCLLVVIASITSSVTSVLVISDGGMTSVFLSSDTANRNTIRTSIGRSRVDVGRIKVKVIGTSGRSANSTGPEMSVTT